MSRLQRRRGSPNGNAILRCGVRQAVLCVVLSSLALFWFQFRVVRDSSPLTNDDASPASTSASSKIPWTCTFREYPDRRYYRLDEKLDFLQNAEYIRGLLPMVLEGTSDLKPHEGKLCVDHSKEVDSSQTRPFSDGTNPSILSVERLPQELRQSLPPQATMLASICMTNGLCAWQDAPEEKERFQLSPLETPNSVYTKLLLLDSKINTLQETVLLLEKDAPWGRKSRQAQKNLDGTFVRQPQAFDDARLFLHSGQVWISYREGPGFGYDKQVISPIHFSFDNKFEALVKASETTTFCCGRNMALVSDGSPNSPLQSLTWVDPVTMIQVDDGLNKNLEVTEKRRRLKSQQKKSSNFHGTNGFLLELPSSGEYLGIGHFHRPPDRNPSVYARHGHHYTHAFFTVTSSPPHKLTRLSREFVFGSKSKRMAPNVADVIQFASGAELVGNDQDGKLLIAYGINDCEAASIYIDMKVVQELLIKVDEGQEVVHLMKKLSS